MSTIPPLRYEEHDLEPVLSRHAVDIHYNKHTKKYYDTAFKLLKDTTYESIPFQELLERDRLVRGTVLYDNVAQAWNHTFYWDGLTTPTSTPTIPDDVKKHIEAAFKTVDKFKSDLVETATNHFASGWLWVAMQNDELTLFTTPNAINPLNQKNTYPLLVIDLWEHAYLYDDRYAADRRKYLTQIWTIIDWTEVSNRLTAISGSSA